MSCSHVFLKSLVSSPKLLGVVLAYTSLVSVFELSDVPVMNCQVMPPSHVFRSALFTFQSHVHMYQLNFPMYTFAKQEVVVLTTVARTGFRLTVCVWFLYNF
jgi:hypothetical protein